MRVVIHFTSSYQTLKSIVESSSLKLFYCKEDFYSVDKAVSRAVHPMVCFSEYNVSTINKRYITYGNYGIAFTKSWIQKNKIHPVLYIDKNSLVAKSLADLLKARRKNAKIQLAAHVRLSIITIKCFIKNSTGFNSKFRIKNFDFKGENEWRYVPTKKQIENNLISQSISKYLKRKAFYNNKLENYSLLFTKDDIEHIFVVNNMQKKEIHELLSIDSNKIKISNWKQT